MLSQLTRHDIQILRRAGVPQGKVAAVTGASVRAVRDIEHEQAVVEIDDRVALAQARVGRPSKAARFRPDVAAILAQEPELLSLEILRRMRLKGYDGRKSAMYALIHELRPKRTRPVVRFEGLPGEFSQHDFGQVDVRFLDGTVRRVHFFASRLKYSRYVQVSLVPDEGTETLVRALVDHFAAIGGIPLVAVFDRPKTVALKWGKDGVVTEWNPTFAYVALELGLGVEVCWPYQPQQKGAVENLVKWVKGSFFKQRRFLDEADLRQQLAEWHTEVNTLRPSRATRVIPAVRLVEERLRPLKVAPAELALRHPVFVGPTAYVTWETNEYAMPAEAQSTAGTLYLYRDRLRIVAGRYQAEHERLEAGDHGRTTSPTLRSDHLAAVAGKRGRRYLQRQHLLDLGPVAQAYLTEIVARRPRAWATDVERLHALLQTHGAAGLLVAMGAAHAAVTFGAEYVTRFLVGAGPSTLAQPQQQELLL
jgi:transposase